MRDLIDFEGNWDYQVGPEAQEPEGSCDVDMHGA